MGNHFVLGQTIEEALKRARSGAARLYRYSFDMLGEGARTAADAARYFEAYARRHRRHRPRRRQRSPCPTGPASRSSSRRCTRATRRSARERVMARTRAASSSSSPRQAKRYDLNFTIDAEEADRLELSLDVIAAVARRSVARRLGRLRPRHPGLPEARARRDRLGRRARRALDRRMMVRLVKGAYWDTEVKRAQERGLDDYPVFTRKAMTDLNYVACADRCWPRARASIRNSPPTTR